jgi:hypothetical protein
LTGADAGWELDRERLEIPEPAGVTTAYHAEGGIPMRAFEETAATERPARRREALA